METIKSNGYTIHTGEKALKLLNTFLKKRAISSCFILCDENTFQHCLPELVAHCPILGDAHIIETESGESSKTIEIAAHIWQTLIDNKADRNTLIVNLGGGVVSDLGGFAASVYKRGIDFVNVPTSLLAMADASVGGKTGIDFSNLKNSIGTFAQPAGVFIYPKFLNTLPHRHLANGMAEIYKMALISDKAMWKHLCVPGSGALKVEHIYQSIKLKNKIVQSDPFEKGKRKILNFGHTIGHAIESILLGTTNELLHGEAVLAGMATEAHLCWQKKMISKSQLEEILSCFLVKFKLPEIRMVDPDEILELIKNDKKAKGKKVGFSLLKEIGNCVTDVEVNATQIKKAISYYNSLTNA